MDLRALHQAIMCQYTPGTPRETINAAQEYCKQLVSDVQCYETLWTLFSDKALPNEIRFWALSELSNIVQNPSKYRQLGDVIGQKLREASLAYLPQLNSSEPIYLRNRFAVFMTMLIKSDFPERWPSAFHDLFESLNLGNDAADNFCRVLSIIDEEIIQYHINRTPEEVAHNCIIKDNMRNGILSRIASLFYQLVNMHYASNPNLASLCLQTFEKYIGWIDIGLVANEHFVPLLFGLLSNQSIRDSAANCIYELVIKGLEPDVKISLYTSLNLTQTLANYFRINDEDFQSKVARIIVAAALHLLAILTGNDKQGTASPAISQAAVDLLAIYIPNVINIFASDSIMVSETALPFLVEYAVYVKKMKTNDQEQAIARQILLSLAARIKYPAQYNFGNEDEDEEHFKNYRRAAASVFKNISQVFPQLALTCIDEVLFPGNTSACTRSFQDAHVGLYLFYQYGESHPAEWLQEGGALAPMMAKLSTSDISSHPHPVVSEFFFECVVRYFKFYLHQPTYLAPVVTAFLDNRGIRSQHSAVRGRSCKLLARFLKAVKSVIQPIMTDMLMNIQDYLNTAIQSQSAATLTNEDQTNLFEAIGFIVGSSTIPVALQEQYVLAIGGPALTHLEQYMGQVYVDPTSVQTLDASRHACHIINVIGIFSKGFSRACIHTNDGIMNFFRRALMSISRLNANFPGNASVQIKILFFFHRMIDILADEVLSCVPVVMGLQQNCETSVFSELLRLIIQLLGKFQESMSSTVEEVFLPILQRLHQITSAPSGSLRNTELEREKWEAKRMLFYFLQSVIINTPDVLLTGRNVSQLTSILDLIVSSLLQDPEMSVKKACGVVLIKLTQEWCGAGTDRLPGFTQYIYDRILPASILCLQDKSINTADSNYPGILVELGNLHILMYTKLGDGYLRCMQDSMASTMKVPAQTLDEFLRLVSKGDINTVKLSIKRLRDIYEQQGLC